MARVGIESQTSRLIAGYLFHCAIMAHRTVHIIQSIKCLMIFYAHARILCDDLHFVDYVAYRHHSGSIFIRTLVATFYELAGQMDVERLSKMVKSSVTSHTSRNHMLHPEYFYTCRYRIKVFVFIMQFCT